MTAALAKSDFRSRAYRVSSQLQSYRDWNDKPFIHLVDGVVSDNLGIRSYLDLFTVFDDNVEAMKSRGLEHVRRVVFIIVNAETKHSTRHWSLLEEDPGLTDVGDVALTAMINSYTYESMALLRQMVKDWSERRRPGQSGSESLDYYVMEVTFKALPDVNERQGFLDLPTSFSLPDADVDRLREAGKRILYIRPDLQRPVRDPGGKIPGATEQPVSTSTP